MVFYHCVKIYCRLGHDQTATLRLLVLDLLTSNTDLIYAHSDGFNLLKKKPWKVWRGAGGVYATLGIDSLC